MEITKILEKNISLLKNLKKEQQQEQLRMDLSILFQQMGYIAIAEEIINNRNAKQNATHGLKMYIKDKKSNRYNIKREIVWTCPPERAKKLNWFENEMMSIINLLEDNSSNQKEYLKLKLEYDNANFEYTIKLAQHDKILEGLTNVDLDNRKKQYEKFTNELKELELIKQETENRLDNFVMNNL